MARASVVVDNNEFDLNDNALDKKDINYNQRDGEEDHFQRVNLTNRIHTQHLRELKSSSAVSRLGL